MAEIHEMPKRRWSYRAGTVVETRKAPPKPAAKPKKPRAKPDPEKVRIAQRHGLADAKALRASSEVNLDDPDDVGLFSCINTWIGKRFDKDNFLLDGLPTTLVKVMREVNRARARVGMKPYDQNPEWIE